MAKGNIGMNLKMSLGRGGFVPDDVPQAEAYALIAFYNATGGSGWTTNTNWLQSRTVDDWAGVTVAAGHVTAIELPNNNLVGFAGATLDPLAATLATLDLGQNTGLTSTGITLTALTALDNIDLADCDFGQTVVSGILEDIVAAGVSAGTLDIGGSNSAPTPSGVTALHALEDDSWTLTYSTVVMENTGSFYAIMANGDATIRSSATDFSGQAGYYVVAYDGTNDKYGTAYGHGADDAEALGATAVLNGDFALWGGVFPNETPTNWTVSTADANNYVTQNPAGVANLVSNNTAGVYFWQSYNVSAGTLRKFTFDMTLASGQWRFSFRDQADDPIVNIDNFTDTGTITYYYTVKSTSTAMVPKWYRWNGGSCDFGVDNVIDKQVTALGTDALQLRNAATGSTRNWTSIESGFDANEISRIEVFNA